MSSTLDAVKSTFSQNLGGVAQNLTPAGQNFSIDEVPDLSGKVAVVTGGSEGIGYACTHTLLSKGVKKVYILSVSQEVVNGAKEAVKSELGEERANATEWIQLDLSDWDKTVEVAKKLAAENERIDILINNAGRGIMTMQLTDKGVDRHMAVNHMGHVLLTSYLLPTLKKTADAGNTVRIVGLSSNAHEQSPKDTEFESLDELNQDLGPMVNYGRSKLAAILYARWLARHLTKEYPQILANATHPGVVNTKQSIEDIHEPYPLAGYVVSTVMRPFKKDVFEGALSTLYAATTTQNSGQYICPPAAVEPGSELSRSENLQDNLMRLTQKVLKEQGGLEHVQFH
ncbi:hypothetical protein DOTSEDRAFT_119478 [Dothistroma septosporum NZE10]|uniref:Uncharacterized protein n=1 Tax=Dothistroma septosporum (strain NZE10 / CBS 128990) TaxID=675120 RepID=N1Q389_DOTSN|nr:hypothetical protein DOTSEDRAFT_119478 [Dothistroma septosporum NZE10]